jgi:PII-like signaling protein
MDGQGKRVTISIGETDQWHHQPLFMAILEFLRREGCAGATVERGIAGFGANSRIKTASLLDLSMDLPVVVTWVDRPDRVERLLPPEVRRRVSMRFSRSKRTKGQQDKGGEPAGPCHTAWLGRA